MIIPPKTKDIYDSKSGELKAETFLRMADDIDEILSEMERDPLSYDWGSENIGNKLTLLMLAVQDGNKMAGEIKDRHQNSFYKLWEELDSKSDESSNSKDVQPPRWKVWKRLKKSDKEERKKQGVSEDDLRNFIAACRDLVNDIRSTLEAKKIETATDLIKNTREKLGIAETAEIKTKKIDLKIEVDHKDLNFYDVEVVIIDGKMVGIMDDLEIEEFYTYPEGYLEPIVTALKGVGVDSDYEPSESYDGEDYPGYFHISKDEINNAIMENKIAIGEGEEEFFSLVFK